MAFGHPHHDSGIWPNLYFLKIFVDKRLIYSYINMEKHVFYLSPIKDKHITGFAKSKIFSDQKRIVMFEPQSPDTIKRVPYPEHPNRCQQVVGGGQCLNFSVEGGLKCIVHGGHKELEAQRNASLRIYRLGQWQARAEELTSHPNIKTLREEIGILRILLEERFAQCQGDKFNLLLQAGPISDLVMKVEKIVTSCHKLEASMGEHIEKSQLLLFASEVVSVIAEVLDDNQEKLDQISFRILDLVNRQTPGPKELTS